MNQNFNNQQKKNVNINNSDKENLPSSSFKIRLKVSVQIEKPLSDDVSDKLNFVWRLHSCTFGDFKHFWNRIDSRREKIQKESNGLCFCVVCLRANTFHSSHHLHSHSFWPKRVLHQTDLRLCNDGLRFPLLLKSVHGIHQEEQRFVGINEHARRFVTSRFKNAIQVQD